MGCPTRRTQPNLPEKNPTDEYIGQVRAKTFYLKSEKIRPNPKIIYEKLSSTQPDPVSG